MAKPNKKVKSYIVKLNKTGKYFKVKYYLTNIIEISFTRLKNKATIFQNEGDEIIAPNKIDKVSFNKIRSSEFNAFLYFNKITKNDITVEEFYAPVQLISAL